jgi:hypothetical protein
MKLSRPEAFFLHNLLFHVSTTQISLGPKEEDDLYDIMNRLCGYVLNEQTTSEVESSFEPDEVHSSDDFLEDEDEDEEDEESDEDEETTDEGSVEVEVLDSDAFISPVVLADLPPIGVVSPAGDKISLEFEDVGEADSVDALLDGGTIIIDTVSQVKVAPLSKALELFDGEEWHRFEVKKFPKAWSKHLVSDTVYGVTVEEGEE